VEITGILFYFVFETLIFFSSIRITYLILKNKKTHPFLEESLILWISLSILISITIASTFSFLTSNGTIQYLSTALILFVVLHLSTRSSLRIYWKYVISCINHVTKNILSLKSILLITILVPFILISLRPVFETDSLLFLNYMLEWKFNEITPYTRAWDLIPTWEVFYLPSLVITNSDNFFWLNSIKPFLILFIGTYLIGKQIKLPNNLALVTAYSSILFFKFWVSTSAITYLKHDILVGAGIILIVFATLRTIQRDLDRVSGLLLLVGLIFVTVKYTGVFVAVLSILLFFLFNFNKIKKIKMKNWLLVSVGIFVVLVFNGHYYVNNFVVFDNPLYPYELPIISEKGTFPETNILSNLGEQKLWEILFFESASKGGWLFPIILAFGVFGTIIILIYCLMKFIKNRTFESNVIFLSIFIFLTWLLYSAANWSAGTAPGDFSRIINLESIRYHFGTIIISEVFFIYILYRLKIPQKFIFIIVGANIIHRLVWMYSFHTLDYSVMAYPAVILIALYLISKISTKISKVSLLSFLVIGLFLFSPQFIEEYKKTEWILPWDDVIFEIYELPASEVFVIEDPDTKKIWARSYPVYGNNFQHNVVMGTEENLVSQINSKIGPSPEYVVKLCEIPIDCKNELKDWAMNLNSYGYETKVVDTGAILLKHKGEK